jgi:hypothetical protein
VKLRIDDIHIVLRGNRPLALLHARGSRLICSEGCAWITVTGEATDFFLRAGEAYRIASDALVLAEAVGQAALRVDTTAAARGWFRAAD